MAWALSSIDLHPASRSHGSGLYPRPPSRRRPPSAHSSKTQQLPLWPFQISQICAPLEEILYHCRGGVHGESSPGYRRNVGICLINSDNKIFSASRLDIPGGWQMPQGGVDEEEDPQIAAFRELKEETGVTSADILAEVPHWLTYDFPPQVREKLNKQWGTDWKGQAQKWFLFRFTGKEDEINLAGDGTEKPEFAEWAWMRPTQVIELAVDFKKPVYEEALKVFRSHFL